VTLHALPAQHDTQCHVHHATPAAARAAGAAHGPPTALDTPALQRRRGRRLCVGPRRDGRQGARVEGRGQLPVDAGCCCRRH
jgi:hypothetical protein